MANRENVIRVTNTEKTLLEMLRNDTSMYNLMDFNEALNIQQRELVKLKEGSTGKGIAKGSELLARAEVLGEIQRLINKVWEER